jgi:hypothetical protein
MLLNEIKNKAKHKHQQLVQIEYIADVKGGHAKKGAKDWVGHSLAKTLVDAKKAKLVA